MRAQMYLLATARESLTRERDTLSRTRELTPRTKFRARVLSAFTFSRITNTLISKEVI